MPNRADREILPFDPEIERSFRRRRREADSREADFPKKPKEKMGEPNTKPLRDYALPTTAGVQSAIVMPTIGANNFEIKSAMIQMMQNSYAFRGMPDDD